MTSPRHLTYRRSKSSNYRGVNVGQDVLQQSAVTIISAAENLEVWAVVYFMHFHRLVSTEGHIL